MTIDGDAHATRARYGVTLLLTLLLVVWLLAGPVDNMRAYLLVLDLLAAGIVVGTAKMTSPGRSRWWMVGIGAIVTASVVATLTKHETDLATWTSIASLLAVAVAVPVLIVRGIARRRRVDLQLVMAALTIYLLVGIASSMGFSAVSTIESEPTIRTPTDVGAASFRDTTYLAFTTLTTTGYGDYTPISGSARAVAMLTALLGQLYLVTAVAGAVSLVVTGGRQHREPGPDA